MNPTITPTPTQEQQAVLEAFKNTRCLKINAIAGAGKTSTLIMLAKDNPKPSLYLCFNKAIEEEAKAKFPPHVECKTNHALAYPHYGKYLRHKQTRPVGFYKNVAGTSQEVAKYYGIEDYKCEAGGISAAAIAALVILTVKRFQNSSESSIQSIHVPYKKIKEFEKVHPDLNSTILSSIILSYAKKLWKDRTNPSSDVLSDYDTYLKLYQLSKPVLDYDTIYLDEAQDSNPAILDIVKRQTHCKIVYVGDTYQSIYEFRGAVNAMETIEAPTMLLSKSFRYGNEIATVARRIISNAINVQGLESISSEIVQDWNEEQYTYIFRTNSFLLETAIKLVQQGKNISITIDTKNLIKQLESAEALKKREMNKVKHEDITPYSTWWDLLQAAKEDPELNRLAKVIEGKRVQEYISLLSQLGKQSKKEFDILLTTAHKSKGCEWKAVRVADDFNFSEDEDNPLNDMPQQELNLLYVACTRAINKLKLPARLENIKEEFV